MEKKYNWSNPSPRDWNPVEKSDGTFCSTACGNKCTKSAYNKAVSDGSKLVLTMGIDWSVIIWENCDWYYRVVKKLSNTSAEIYYKKNSDDYACYIQSNPQFIGKNKDPQIAYKEACGLFLEHYYELTLIKESL